ncbi:MAG TPA: hypothetical protein VF339_12370 [Gammaproteobacteria bacterium]
MLAKIIDRRTDLVRACRQRPTGEHDRCGRGSTSQGYVVFHVKMLGDTSGLQDFRAATNGLETIGLARRQLDLPDHASNLHIDWALDGTVTGTEAIARVDRT